MSTPHRVTKCPPPMVQTHPQCVEANSRRGPSVGGDSGGQRAVYDTDGRRRTERFAPGTRFEQSRGQTGRHLSRPTASVPVIQKPGHPDEWLTPDAGSSNRGFRFVVRFPDPAGGKRRSRVDRLREGFDLVLPLLFETLWVLLAVRFHVRGLREGLRYVEVPSVTLEREPRNDAVIYTLP